MNAGLRGPRHRTLFRLRGRRNGANQKECREVNEGKVAERDGRMAQQAPSEGGSEMSHATRMGSVACLTQILSPDFRKTERRASCAEQQLPFTDRLKFNPTLER